jgi:kexin
MSKGIVPYAYRNHLKVKFSKMKYVFYMLNINKVLLFTSISTGLALNYHTVIIMHSIISFGLSSNINQISIPSKQQTINFNFYDLFAINVERTDINSVTGIATELNMTFYGQIGQLKHYYMLLGSKLKDYSQRLEAHKDIVWHELQVPSRSLFKRKPSDIQSYANNLHYPTTNISQNIKQLRQKFQIFDPGFHFQWHLANNRDIRSDLNLTDIWLEGITGKGVIVAFIDDGVEHDHPDLIDNYWKEGSYDFNNHKIYSPLNDDDTHGTRCAGTVAAARNDICGVGIAFDAKIAGIPILKVLAIRILSAKVSKADEAAAINYGFDKTHIYSCSWGPVDDGTRMAHQHPLVKSAFKNGVENGRQGLGSIYVFAAGNGGEVGDNW